MGPRGWAFVSFMHSHWALTSLKHDFYPCQSHSGHCGPTSACVHGERPSQTPPPALFVSPRVVSRGPGTLPPCPAVGASVLELCS